MAGPHEQAQQTVPFMERLPIPANANQAALSRVFARLSAALPAQEAQQVASPGGAAPGSDWSKALASQRSTERMRRPGTARTEASPRKSTPRGRSNSVDRQRMTSPGRLYSSRGRGAHAGREGLEVRDPQLTALQQQCAAATERCQELEATLREKDMEVRSLKARNAKLRSEKANERMKRQMNAVDQVLQPEDAAGARLEGPGFGKDHRLALLIKKVKSLEESRDEALSLAERAQAAIVPVREALEAKALQSEEVEKRCQAQAHELDRQHAKNEKLEAHLKAEAESRAQLQEQMEQRRGDFERVCAEVDSLRSVRAELLERTVKRDRKVDTLQRKVKALGEALETEQKARAKAEDEIANLEDRMRTIRKRSAALEGRCNQEKEQKEALLRDVQMKEEECCLLVKMVNNPLAHDAAAGRLTDADTIAEQSERIKILLAEVSRLRFAGARASPSPRPEPSNPASPFDQSDVDWAAAPTKDSQPPAAAALRPKTSRRPDAVEAAARLSRRKSSKAFGAPSKRDSTASFEDSLQQSVDGSLEIEVGTFTTGNGQAEDERRASPEGVERVAKVHADLENEELAIRESSQGLEEESSTVGESDSESEWEETDPFPSHLLEDENELEDVPIVEVVLSTS